MSAKRLASRPHLPPLRGTGTREVQVASVLLEEWVHCIIREDTLDAKVRQSLIRERCGRSPKSNVEPQDSRLPGKFSRKHEVELRVTETE